MRLLGYLAALVFIAGPAAAQDPVRILPGFEKVYSKFKKKEAETFREMSRADAAADAAGAMRREGEMLVADSNAAIDAQKDAYVALTQRLGRASAAPEAADEARALHNIAEAWLGAEQNRAKGEAMIRQAEIDAAKAAERRLAAEGDLADIRLSLDRTIDTSPVPVAAPAGSAVDLAPPPNDVAPTPVEPGPLPPVKPSGSIEDALLGGSAAAAPLKSD